MATMSFWSDIPRHYHHRRDSASSNKSIGARRPRLLRAYATQPSIAVENVCSGMLTSQMYSTRRAAELLSRVVISSGSVSPTNAPPRSPEIIQPERLTETRLTETNHESDWACYFSFPSPDTWGEPAQDDKEIEAESP